MKEAIANYHAAQSEADRTTYDTLLSLVDLVLPEAQGRVWHVHPVFFLDDNPVVGYSVLKGGVRLLFWSGQSFDEPALSPVGKFEAAKARLALVDDVDERNLR